MDSSDFHPHTDEHQQLRKQLASDLAKTATLHGTFTLRSGAVSDTYFDKYLFEADPALLLRISKEMVQYIPTDTQALAGLEMGGIPIATLLSQHTGLPTRFVRKAAKDYGTCKIAEGGSLKGVKLCLVEDVVTSGGAVLDAAEALRSAGAELLGVVCVIDREATGRDNLKEIGLPMWPLFTRSELEAS
jgi:orotate phosphoribosyltransferase